MAATTFHSYIDIDLSFMKHPGTKDLLKKYDGDATKQALKNLFYTNPFEKPFDPMFGIGLQRMLFEQNDVAESILGNYLSRRIREMIEYYEPRVVIDDLRVDSPSNSNAVTIQLAYHSIENPIQDTVSFSFRRAR
jgi:phage baseplate assembly protein W